MTIHCLGAKLITITGEEQAAGEKTFIQNVCYPSLLPSKQPVACARLP